MIDDADAATAQALRMAQHGEVTAVDGQRVALKADTLCLHGDGTHAVDFARRLRAALEAAGLRIAAPAAA